LPCFADEATHIAAKQENYPLTKLAILRMLKIPSDITIIEGVGGWYTPINEHELMSDVVTSIKLPVILVVGLKLGCVNHSILTTLAIKEAKLPLIGNCIDPSMQAMSQNIESLKSLLPTLCLGIVPYGHKLDHLNLYVPCFQLLRYSCSCTTTGSAHVCALPVVVQLQL